MSDPTLGRFFTSDGRLHTIEPVVKAMLQRFHPDHAALRRYLVDNLFLTRERGQYWRTGGAVDG